MRLIMFVAEIRACGHVHHETWTVKAKSIADAKRRLIVASGDSTEILAVAAAREVPTRHWRAG